ncbi:MAG: transglycosylase SLT domain-containing protein [Bacteriovoracia bacterium]
MFATLLLLSVFFQLPDIAPALAQQSPSEAPTVVSDPAIPQPGVTSPIPIGLSVENLESSLMKDKKKRIPIFGKIQKALDAKNWTKLLTLTRLIEKNTEFSDYYHFLRGQAELERMKGFKKKKMSATAISAGERAVYHFTNVPLANIYTPLHRKSLVLLGEAKLILGDLFYRIHKSRKAMQAYEYAFHELTQINLNSLVSQDSVTNYFVLCEKKPSEICTGWEMKFLPVLSAQPKPQSVRLMERVRALQTPPIEKAVSSVPYKVDLDLQLFEKGFQYYLSGKHSDAYTTWDDLLRQYPRSNIRLRTKFWMARAAQKSNHMLHAETLYKEVIQTLPFSYYALLAAKFSGIDLSRMMLGNLPTGLPESPILSAADVVHIHRAEKLIASGAGTLATYELRDTISKDQMTNEFLVYLAMLNDSAKNHWTVFQIFGELSTRGYQGFYSAYGQKLFFPTTFLANIKKATQAYKIDPLIPLSIIKQESAFHAEVVSRSAAFGLMQIIPPTARDLDPKIEISELWNPDKNIQLGVKYIAQLLNRYKGSLILALAAYNAGPGNADRWSKDFKPGMTYEEMVELIGYRETREYVSNIVRNYYWYRKRLQQTSSANPEIVFQLDSK